MATMQLRPGMRVLDLGGSVQTWTDVPVPLHITLLNLPGHVGRAGPSHHAFEYLEGDACDVAAFADKAFDIVFSNSVIEHVGDKERQRQFAHEVRRLGARHWVQTPSKYFPIEPHVGMPFWWYLPNSLRLALIEHWRPKLPDWVAMVEQTTVLDRSWLQDLFPGATVHTEFLAGLPKSYVVQGTAATH